VFPAPQPRVSPASQQGPWFMEFMHSVSVSQSSFWILSFIIFTRRRCLILWKAFFVSIEVIVWFLSYILWYGLLHLLICL
jgi:hypothetical protein